MGIYLNETVIAEMRNTDTIINRELEEHDGISLFADISKMNNDDLLNTCLLKAWKIFYHQINFDNKHLDENTPFNQENIANYISFNVENYVNNKVVFLSDLLRVLYEFVFWTGVERNTGVVSHDTLTELSDRFDHAESKNAQFRFIRDNLSVCLMKWLLNSPNFVEAKSLIFDIQSKKDSFIEEVATRKAEYLNDIAQREKEAIKTVTDEYTGVKHSIKIGKEELEKKVNDILSSLSEVEALEKRVGNLKSEYNFVGLSSGFNKIKEKKELELREIEVNYKNLFGCIFIVPILLSLLHLFKPGIFPKDYTILFLALPFFTIEMALIYFFRLSYLEAKSIRTQLVQIELRLSLCSFIDGYVDYRKKNNVNFDKVLDNFDSLIFSPIQTNENNIPSMFDGVEALAGLAEKITKK